LSYVHVYKTLSETDSKRSTKTVHPCWPDRCPTDMADDGHTCRFVLIIH